jgi:ferredoxin
MVFILPVGPQPRGGRSSPPSPRRVHDTDGNSAVKVQIDPGRCQGHGRCYDLAPDLFSEDDEGYGQVRGDGAVPAGGEAGARRAEANCPERAISLG